MKMSSVYQRGFSLVEVMIGTAIMATGFAAMISMMNAQMRNQKYVQQKYEAMELAAQLKTRLPQGSFCRCNFQGTNDLTGGPVERILNRIFQVQDPDAAGCAEAHNIIPPGGVIPAGSGLKVKSLTMKNLMRLTGGAPDRGKMDIEIEFEHELETTPIKPVKLTDILVRTSGPPNATVIESCGEVGSAAAVPQEQEICQMLGFVYDAAAVPPVPRCRMTGGSPAANQLCLLIRGVPTPLFDGTPGCRISINPNAQYPSGLQCTVPLATSMNLRLDDLPKLRERLVAIAGSFTLKKKIEAIFALAGVDYSDRTQVVAFLRTESFNDSPFTDRLMRDTGLDRNSAATVLGDVAHGLRGSLN